MWFKRSKKWLAISRRGRSRLRTCRISYRSWKNQRKINESGGKPRRYCRKPKDSRAATKTKPSSCANRCLLSRLSSSKRSARNFKSKMKIRTKLEPLIKQAIGARNLKATKSQPNRAPQTQRRAKTRTLETTNSSRTQARTTSLTSTTA